MNTPPINTDARGWGHGLACLYLCLSVLVCGLLPLHAGTVAYAQPFATSHGWTFTQSTCTSGATCSSNAAVTTDGNPANSVSATVSVKSKTLTGYWTHTYTWEAMGVPAGATVTGLSLLKYDMKASAISSSACLNTSNGGVEVWDSANTTECTSATSNNGTSSAVWQTVDNTQSRTWSGGCSGVSTTVVTLRLNVSLGTGATTGAACTLFTDNYTVTITYATATNATESLTWTATGGSTIANAMTAREAPAALNATGGSTIANTLTAREAPAALNATGGSTIATKMTAAESPSWNATGGTTLANTIAAGESRTFAATGATTATGGLTQADSISLNGSGVVSATGAQGATEAASLNATGGSTIASAMTAAEARTYSATGGTTIANTMTAAEARTYSATGGTTATGGLGVADTADFSAATGATISAKLTASPSLAFAAVAGSSAADAVAGAAPALPDGPQGYDEATAETAVAGLQVNAAVQAGEALTFDAITALAWLGEGFSGRNVFVVPGDRIHQPASRNLFQVPLPNGGARPGGVPIYTVPSPHTFTEAK